MNRNRHGILVVEPSQRRRKAPQIANKIRCKPAPKYKDYVELYRTEGFEKVWLVMPYIEKEVTEKLAEGWLFIQKFSAKT